MSYLKEFKKIEAARKREVRDSVRHQKDLQRRFKEQAKLSELERARLEVESFETEIEVLLSIHKEVSSVMDWKSFAFGLPPHQPVPFGKNLAIATLRNSITPFAAGSEEWAEDLVKADLSDSQERINSLLDHEKECAQFERMHVLSKNVLAGDTAAFGEALTEFSAISEIANLGASISVSFDECGAVNCILSVNGNKIIPTQVKSLTLAGKLSVKPMQKSRFHEIYQDYVCSSVLRVAREIFALLPLDLAIVTATIEEDASSSGSAREIPVLSVAIPRAELEKLDFDGLDPSEAITTFVRRGDAMVSRKSGEFKRIVPLEIEDIRPAIPSGSDFQKLITQISILQGELSSMRQSNETKLGTLLRFNESAS